MVNNITSCGRTARKKWKNYTIAWEKHGKVEDLLDRLGKEGKLLNIHTYIGLLRRCTDLKDAVSGKQVHTHITRSCIQPTTILTNAILNMYIKCGHLRDAFHVFNNASSRVRDRYTWGIMLGGYSKHQCFQEVLHIYEQMRNEGVIPDKFMFTNVINACANLRLLESGKQVHADLLKCGIKTDIILANTLIDMYAKCGSVRQARELFDKMDIRDVVTWNAMIGGYARDGHFVEAFELFQQMSQGALKPDPVTYINILTACSNPEALTFGRRVHVQIVGSRFQSDVRVATALVNMYAKCGSIQDAQQVFDKMVTRNIYTWNVLIGAYAEIGCGDKAFEFLTKMQQRQHGVEPDAITFLAILNPRATSGALEWVKDVHAQVQKAGLQSDVRVGNALINMFAKSGNISDARDVFEKMAERDLVTWSSMIGGLALHGYGQEALQLFEHMKREGFKPNAMTMMGVLSACRHSGLVEECQQHFSAMSEQYGIVPEIEHYGCMVDVLGSAGHLDEAEDLVKNMPMDADASIWGALLGACRIHGNVRLAEHAATHYLKLEPENAGIYVALSNVYSAAGMQDCVLAVRSMMGARGVRKEPGRSWIEVNKKVHYFVADDRSHPQAEDIYSELNRLTQEMKKTGYVPDTRLVLHDVDKQQKEEALCFHSEKLAIAYGLISTPLGTPIRVFKNLRVCSDCHVATKFITMVTGREIVVRDGSRFHHFKNGVCSCGDYW